MVTDNQANPLPASCGHRIQFMDTLPQLDSSVRIPLMLPVKSSDILSILVLFNQSLTGLKYQVGVVPMSCHFVRNNKRQAKNVGDMYLYR